MLASYTTPSGILVERTVSKIPYEKGLKPLLEKLDTQRGIYFSSSYELPGRHTCWDIAGLNPSLEIVSAGRELELRALNARGEALNRMLEPLLSPHPHWESLVCTPGAICGRLNPLPALFAEEERSKQPSAFSILRTILNEFKNPLGSKLALIGAFGYDLLLQFDPIQLKKTRQGLHDLRLFFCDELYFMDHKLEQIELYRHDFTLGEITTRGLKRTGARLKAPKTTATGPVTSDHSPEEYQAKVQTVREGMRRGDYYEVVLCQMFRARYQGSLPELFERIKRASPSPYEFLLQFGEEQLIGASPEIFVRVREKRIESSPIAGTTRRTGDPMRDAENIRALLASKKEESELTMCTDVDRNDKSRVCAPGSVQVIGRRVIEPFAGVYHTVDHVEGMLADGFDALDAFLTHMWSVTIIGAPKKWAAQAIEDLEKEPRGWYTGAVGMLSLDGNMNTGITIRTIHLRDGIARYGAGATLLYDSIPENEDRECHMKASNFFRALEAQPKPIEPYRPAPGEGRGLRLLLVDNEDCFIHTLSNYARQTGAEVITYRAGFPLDLIDDMDPSLLLLSPGPGRPSDFGLPDLVRYAVRRDVPIFGVCLGLQGIVEAFGGELGLLDYPMHGKRSLVRNSGVGVFSALPAEFTVGFYHSLHAIRASLPSCLEITAETEDGIIMGIRHRDLPIEAVQFHPESILTLEEGAGLRLMENAVLRLSSVKSSTGAHIA
jgi:anthranilate synthase